MTHQIHHDDNDQWNEQLNHYDEEAEMAVDVYALTIPVEEEYLPNANVSNGTKKKLISTGTYF